MAKEIKKGDRLTSTSDFTVDDVVDYVAKNLGCGDCRGEIERIVKDVVRPCAIDGGLQGSDAPGLKVSTNVATGAVTIQVGGKGGCGGSSYDKFCGTCKDRLAGKCEGPSAAGECDQLKRAEKGASPNLAMTSKWYNTVLQNGEVWTPYTNRRFLPAQYLRLMEQFDGNIDKAIAVRYSLKEMWKLLEYELNNLVFMQKHWRTAYVERSRFLTIEGVRTIFEQYLNGLSTEINDRGQCTFSPRKGIFWRKISGTGRVELWKEINKHQEGADGFVSNETIIEPTKWLVKLNVQIAIARNRTAGIRTYADALDVLVRHMPRISMGTFKDGDGCIRNWLPKAWKEQFKKQGAYYTLKSLIVNGHVRLATEDGDWRSKTTTVSPSARDSLVRLQGLIDSPAYVIHAILKKSIVEAHLSVAKFLRRICRH